MTNVDVGSIPLWVNVAQRRTEKTSDSRSGANKEAEHRCPIAPETQFGNGMRFVLRCCEGALRLSKSLLGRGKTAAPEAGDRLTARASDLRAF